MYAQRLLRRDAETMHVRLQVWRLPSGTAWHICCTEQTGSVTTTQPSCLYAREMPMHMFPPLFTCNSSTSTLTNLTLGYLVLSCSNTGAIALQGPHHSVAWDARQAQPILLQHTAYVTCHGLSEWTAIHSPGLQRGTTDTLPWSPTCREIHNHSCTASEGSSSS